MTLGNFRFAPPALLAFLLVSAPAAEARERTFIVEFERAPSVAALASSADLWSCRSTVCLVSGEATAAPSRICRRLVSAFGRVEGFTVDGRAFGDTALTRCNAD